MGYHTMTMTTWSCHRLDACTAIRYHKQNEDSIVSYWLRKKNMWLAFR